MLDLLCLTIRRDWHGLAVVLACLPIAAVLAAAAP